MYTEIQIEFEWFDAKIAPALVGTPGRIDKRSI